MSGPCKEDAQLAAVEKEVGTINETIPHPRLVSDPEAEEDDIYYLSGKPFFDVVLAKTHVAPLYQLWMPASMISLLPHATVPVVLRHGGKNWNLSYVGGCKRPRFDSSWRAFVTENHLEVGDACVFELMENSGTNLRFKVHVMKNDDLPPELLEVIDSYGKTPETAIKID